MNDSRRAFNLLGMAMRARMLTLGLTATLKAIEGNKVHLVVLAADIGDNSRSKIKASAEIHHIPMRVIGTRDELGRCFGRNEVGVIGVEDDGFAKSLKDL